MIPLFNIGNIFKSASNVVDSVGNTADNLITSKDEKNQSANERLKVDSMNDSWLSKNIRPLILLMFTIFFFATILFDIKVLPQEYIIIQMVLKYAIAFYYGSRLIEKLKFK